MSDNLLPSGWISLSCPSSVDKNADNTIYLRANIIVQVEDFVGVFGIIDVEASTVAGTRVEKCTRPIVGSAIVIGGAAPRLCLEDAISVVNKITEALSKT